MPPISFGSNGIVQTMSITEYWYNRVPSVALAQVDFVELIEKPAQLSVPGRARGVDVFEKAHFTTVQSWKGEHGDEFFISNKRYSYSSINSNPKWIEGEIYLLYMYKNRENDGGYQEAVCKPRLSRRPAYSNNSSESEIQILNEIAPYGVD